jgi:acetyl-CoA C-acetyltransferase
MAHDGDRAVLELLSSDQPIGQRVYARAFGFGNRVTTSPEPMAGR